MTGSPPFEGAGMDETATPKDVVLKMLQELGFNDEDKADLEDSIMKVFGKSRAYENDRDESN